MESNNINKAKESVLVKSNKEDLYDYNINSETDIIKGYEFNNGIDYEKLFNSYYNTGFQAYNLGKAIKITRSMLEWRLSDDPIENEEEEKYKDPEIRKKTKNTIFLGYTSNLVSCGLREMIRYLCEHKLVDVIVTTAGGIEEDFIKCLGPTYQGEFSLKGSELRSKGLNRIGNLLVPNDNYCKFEDWITPKFEKMFEEQRKGKNWTPSKMIEFLGHEIDNKESIYYWTAKNGIPVFCPALTDGSIGDMLFFRNFSDDKERIRLDIVEDIVRLNKIALDAKKTGMLIVGGGIIKHHINNANLMRNGADYAVYINTGQEYDGSDAGARPDEAISWGKIKAEAMNVKVYAEATLVLPILIAEAFVRYKEQQDKMK